MGGTSQHKKQQTLKLLTDIEAKLIVASNLQSIGFVNNSIIYDVLTDHIKVCVFLSEIISNTLESLLNIYLL